MPNMELGPLGPPRPIDTPRIDRAPSGRMSAHAARIPEDAQASGPQVRLDTGPGEAPVDADRVAAVRDAVEKGSYPLVPARVADAMIAAGELLQRPRS